MFSCRRNAQVTFEENPQLKIIWLDIKFILISINFRLPGIYQYSVLNQFEAADPDLEEDYPEFTQVLSYYLIILLSCYPVI